jgi:hypothetical protein
MRAVLPRHVLGGNKPQICLVHERRRLQAVTDCLTADMFPRNAMEFVIHQRYQSFERTIAALPPFEQESGHFCSRDWQGLILGPFETAPGFFHQLASFFASLGE